MTTLYITAPASPLPPDEIEPCVHAFEAKGYRVLCAPHIAQASRFMAGSDEQRASDVMAGFLNPQVDMIVALKGGYGSPRLLNRLDYQVIKKHAKPFFGFSDITALQLALWTQAQMPSFSGLNAGFISRNWPMVMGGFDAAVSGQPCHSHVHVTYTRGLSRVQGTVIAGTLSMIVSVLGTPYCPDFKDTILIIEDVGEQPYQIDRLLTHLRLAGVFQDIAALGWGRFANCVSKDAADGTLEDVIQEWSDMVECPVIADIPYGHLQDHTVIPVGGCGEIDLKNGILTIQNPFQQKG